jgi:endonuclease YncB( thermonuclease family)
MPSGVRKVPRQKSPWQSQQKWQPKRHWRWRYSHVRDGLLLIGAMALVGQYTFNHGIPKSLPDIRIPMPVAEMPAAKSTAGGSFSLCGGNSRNCVIDGDTIEYEGVRIRMWDYDTPEISNPKCDSEEALGHEAKRRLVEILNSGTVEVISGEGRDEDQFGRKLRLVTVNGRSVGDTLIAEGLAWQWEGRRHKWCD